MTRRRWLAAVGVIVLAGVAGLALAWLGRAPVVHIDHTDAALVAHGEPLYRQHCAACHGAKLEGQPNWQSRDARGRLPAPPHDDSGHTWHHDDQVLFEVTKFGLAKVAPGYESDMPAFAGVLSDREIVAVMAYIKSQWSAPIHAKRGAAGMH